jgi:hypothetical protein
MTFFQPVIQSFDGGRLIKKPLPVKRDFQKRDTATSMTFLKIFPWGFIMLTYSRK